ncbi:MAG: hypothetical protein GY832_31030 [Chloroflexi bacterium]|nr:hypothetical protein [Chloroflexota bacterium]
MWKTLADLPENLTIALNGVSLPDKKRFLDTVNALIASGVPEAEAVTTSLSGVDRIKSASGIMVSNDDEYLIEGFASSSRRDVEGDVIPTEAVIAGFANYLGTVLLEHDAKIKVGQVVDYEVRGDKVWIQVQIDPSEKKIWSKIKKGIIQGFSLRFSGLLTDYDQTTETRTYGKVRIKEISLVSEPRNRDAWITGVKSASEPHETPEGEDTMGAEWQEKAIRAESEANKFKSDLSESEDKLKSANAELETAKSEKAKLEAEVEKYKSDAEAKADAEWIDKLKSDNFEPGMVEKLKGERAYYADHPEQYDHLKSANKPTKNSPKTRMQESENATVADIQKQKYQESLKKAREAK